MGEGAISVVTDLQRQVEALTNIVNQQTVQIDRLIGVTRCASDTRPCSAPTAAKDGARVTSLRDLHERHVATMRVFVARPFLARLRWLLTGR
jgi:hypothetical protein